MEQFEERAVSTGHGTEYEIACRVQAIDNLLGAAFHLFLYISKGGVIRTVSGLSTEMTALNFSPLSGCEPFSLSRVFEGLSIDTAFPWLSGDWKGFVHGSAEHMDVSKKVYVMARTIEYQVRFSKVFNEEDGSSGAIISIMAQSEICRTNEERRRLRLLEENFREVRMFCHDFSQPLMVLMGYWELITATQPIENKQLIKREVAGIQHEIDRLSSSFQKLRHAIMQCRRQIEPPGSFPST